MIKTSSTISSARRAARRLRTTALLVLLLGIAGEAMVYCLEKPSASLSNDPSMLGYDKKQARQLATLYGNQAVLVQKWADELKQPGTQALIIVVAAALVAGGCFYIARLLDQGD